MLLSNLQIPPPKNWEAFEDLCCDLWKEIWKSPHTQKHGRRGQKQSGVDIYGRPAQGSKWAGIQCKGKDHYSDKTLTKDEVIKEVEEAKNFDPKLSEFIIATTGKKDAKIEELSRKITDEHLQKGLFTVTIYAWEDILKCAENYTHIIDKHFNVLASDVASGAQLLQVKQELISYGEESTEKVLTEISKLPTSKYRNTDYSLSEVSKEHHAELDYSRNLLDNNNPNAAYKYLLDLKERIWSVSEDIIKFRILTNMGCAKLNMNQEKEALDLLFEAHQYNPDDEISLCNIALAHLISGEFEEAKLFAKKAISKNKANKKAYSIIIQTTQQIEDIESLLKEFPKPIKSSAEVAYAIGSTYRSKGDLESALKWYELAVKNNKEDIPEFRGSLGELLVEIALKENSLIIANELNNLDKEKVLKANNILKEVWQQISKSELKHYRISWILGISISEALLGNKEEAVQFAEEALTCDPDNPELIRHRAVLALKNGGISRGLELIAKIKDSKEIPDLPILQAELLRRNNQGEKAKEILKRFIESNPPLKLKEYASFLLADIFIDENEIDEAKEILELLQSFSSSTIRINIYYARVCRLLGEKNKAIDLLEQQNKFAEKYEDLILLASEYYFNGNFKEAASIYEKVVDLEICSPLSIRLIKSYYQAGLKDKTLELCQILTKKHGPIDTVSEVECSIYEEIGDLSTARKVCTDYLKIFPDDLDMRLRLAVVNFRDNKNERVDEFLKEEINFEDLTLNNGIILSELLSRRNLEKESLKLLYELRRKFFDKREIHFHYIANFAGRDESVNEMLDIDKIGLDSAVLIEDLSGQSEWFLLEDRKDIDISKKEINDSYPIFKAVISKEEGDEVLLKVTPFSERKRKIKKHISKYVFAFQESLSKFEVLFPFDKSIQMIEVGKEEEVSDLPPELKKFLEFMGEQNKNHLDILNFYKGRNLTIGSVAKLLRKNEIDIWALLINDYNLGVRCCFGNKPERNEALKNLDRNSPQLIIDLISILTLFEIGFENRVIEIYGKLGIAQSTIDFIKIEIDHRKSFSSKSTSSIGKLGDKYIIYETNPEDIKKTIEHLEKILTWISKNCEVIPAKASLKLEEEQRKRLYDFFGTSFIDTIFIASEEGKLLYSDDLLLRIFSKEKYDVNGVWTQILLFDSRNKNIITKDDYTSYVMKLASLYYFHTAIEEAVLLKAAEHSNWYPKWPYTNVLQMLSGEHADDDSALIVSVNFLYSLFDLPIIDFVRENLIYVLLEKLLLGRNRKIMIDRMKKRIKNKYRLVTPEEIKLIETVQHWESTHII